MKDLINLASSLEKMMDTQELVQNLQQRIDLLEQELHALKGTAKEGWVSLTKAADEVGLSENALRQRIKKPQLPMPKGKVWKQQCKGAAIFVNLKELRKAL